MYMYELVLLCIVYSCSTAVWVEALATVNCQTLTTFGIHIYIYFGGVWKGFGSGYIYLSYTIECSFIRVSRGFGRGLGQDIYIYWHSKRCVS